MTVLRIESSSEMEALGAAVGGHLVAGNVVVLHGPLGAGKTTFTRGVGAALEVEGVIQSPTFVVAREHAPAHAGRPRLVHVDAYRLSHADELVDLDIDYDHSVVVIEWGRPFVEKVVDQRLDVDIHTSTEDSNDLSAPSEDGERVVTLTAHARAETDSRFHALLAVLNDFGH
ncbi:MAG: tRNA threonylcarbamoyladenosine biosynthesis protein TsaE [Cellulomonadaceae bacterium TMED98]|nr:MAG: tRNA threonylcarbamoyladenosine biosynthesis protein TsaE [Cellulomonadaceae bacterium TMED98]